MIRMNESARALAWPVLLVAALAMTPGSASAQAGDETVQLVPGGRAMIDLVENPSTGYVWRFDAARSKNAAIVQVIDQGFTRPPSDTPPIGAPGRHRMRGHYAYYGISGNSRRLSWYADTVPRIWQKWL